MLAVEMYHLAGKPEYDDDGNIIGGEWLEYPRDGQLWFDTRQGRLVYLAMTVLSINVMVLMD